MKEGGGGGGEEDESSRSVIELNVGGVVYSTTALTLSRCPDSILSKAAAAKGDDSSSSGGSLLILRDSKGRCFFDRDGPLFRFILNFLRCPENFRLPENFRELDRLRQEAEFYRLPEMISRLSVPAHAQSHQNLSLPLWSPGRSVSGDWTSAVSGPYPQVDRDGFSGLSPLQLQGITVKEPGYIVLGYRGSFQFGRDGQADVKFRKMTRILASGRVSVCREVFQDTLNESRDPDRGTSDRYSARFFLKHSFIEQAFDMLLDAGFRLVGSCGSGTSSVGEAKPGVDSEETKWNHYNEFIFCRP